MAVPRRSLLPLVLPAVTVHAVLGLRLVLGSGLDTDEAYSLATTDSTLAAAWQRAIDFELQPPGWFALLQLWRSAGDGVVWARLLSLLASMLAVWLGARLGDRLAGRKGAAALAWILALHPQLLWFGSTIRCYAVVMALAMAMVLAAVQWRQTGSGRAAAWFAAASTLAFYTQYYTLFLCAAAAVAVGCDRWRRAGWPAWLALLAVPLLCAPMLPVVLEQTGLHRSAAPSPTAFICLRHTGLHFAELGGSLRTLLGSPELRPWSLLALAAAAATALMLLWRRWRTEPPARWPLLGVAAHLALLAVACRLVGRAGVDLRHCVALLPWVGCLLAGVVLPAAVSWRALAAAVLLLALPGQLAHWAVCGSGERPPANAAVGRLLDGDATAAPVFVFPSDSALALRYSLERPRPLFGLPDAASLTSYQPQAFALPDAAGIRDRIQARLGGADTAFWVVAYDVPLLFGVDLNLPAVDEFARRCCEIVQVHTLPYCRLWLLRLRGS